MAMSQQSSILTSNELSFEKDCTMASPIVATDLNKLPQQDQWSIKELQMWDTIGAPVDFPSGDKRVILNVGGVRHETYVATLKSVPNSRLWRLASVLESDDTGLREFFFDQNSIVFAYILDLYRTGELHVPTELCCAMVKRELDFWQIDESLMKPCCQRRFVAQMEKESAMDAFEKCFRKGQEELAVDNVSGWEKLRGQFRFIIEHPGKTRGSKIYASIYCVFVFASIVGMCVETIPELTPQFANATSGSCMDMVENYPLYISLICLDVLCTAFFSGELFFLFFVPEKRASFFQDILSWTDLIATIPLLVQIIFEATSQRCDRTYRVLDEVLSSLRIFRIFRLAHLVRHLKTVKVLSYTIKASLQELTIILISLSVACVVFATIVFYAERDSVNRSPCQFTSIPKALWWAIITMTTVGYGDVVPSTPMGRIVGTVCAVGGVLTFALLVPIWSNYFTFFYGLYKSIPPSSRRKTSKQEEDDTMRGGGKSTDWHQQGRFKLSET